MWDDIYYFLFQTEIVSSVSLQTANMNKNVLSPLHSLTQTCIQSTNCFPFSQIILNCVSSNVKLLKSIKLLTHSQLTLTLWYLSKTELIATQLESTSFDPPNYRRSVSVWSMFRKPSECVIGLWMLKSQYRKVLQEKSSWNGNRMEIGFKFVSQCNLLVRKYRNSWNTETDSGGYNTSKELLLSLFQSNWVRKSVNCALQLFGMLSPLFGRRSKAWSLYSVTTCWLTGNAE